MGSRAASAPVQMTSSYDAGIGGTDEAAETVEAAVGDGGFCVPSEALEVAEAAEAGRLPAAGVEGRLGAFESPSAS